jgi:hypothetical protein
MTDSTFQAGGYVEITSRRLLWWERKGKERKNRTLSSDLFLLIFLLPFFLIPSCERVPSTVASSTLHLETKTVETDSTIEFRWVGKSSAGNSFIIVRAGDWEIKRIPIPEGENVTVKIGLDKRAIQTVSKSASVSWSIVQQQKTIATRTFHFKVPSRGTLLGTGEIQTYSEIQSTACGWCSQPYCGCQRAGCIVVGWTCVCTNNKCTRDCVFNCNPGVIPPEPKK